MARLAQTEGLTDVQTEILQTVRDTPIFTCVRRGLRETLDLLGG